MTFEKFVADRKTIDAVVRNFMIIGEAATHLPEDFIEKHPDLLNLPPLLPLLRHLIRR